VFYFTAQTPGYEGWPVYMGKDQFENDALIEWGWRSDVWFHVDSLSSAHVYLRLPMELALACDDSGGDLTEMIPEDLIEEMCQLVKANSIEGSKKASVSVVYTAHSNLRKDSSMKDGSVGFHASTLAKHRLTEKNREVVKLIEKTRREGAPDLQAEKMEFEQRAVMFIKQRTKERAEFAAANDPGMIAKKKEADKKKQHEEFLSSGGYHSGSLTRDDPTRSVAAFKKQQAQAALMTPSTFGGSSSATGGGFSSALLDDELLAEGEDEPEPASWEDEAALRETGGDVDLKWLRERGYDTAAAIAALEGAEGAGDQQERRLAALGLLLPRNILVGDATEEDAVEAREEEREALAAIFDEDYAVLGGEDVALPVQGFEPLGYAPPLILEMLIDASAAEGYPIGKAVPLLALVGGGLAESELRELTTLLVGHAVSNIDLGPLGFELTTVAAEKATETVERRVAAAKRRVARAAALERRAKQEAEKAAGPAVAVNAEAERNAAITAAKGRIESKPAEKKREDKIDLVADLLDGGGVDKGGYKPKKKKKK